MMPAPQQTGTWRDKIAIHPAAELIPPLSSSEMEALKADIAVHGIVEPVVVMMKPVHAHLLDTMQAIELIDGRHRLDAAEAAGITVFRENGKLAVPHRIIHVEHPFDFVVSANLHRRHLSAEQKRELILAIKAAAPERSVRAIAEATGIPKSTIGRVLAAPVPNGTPDEAGANVVSIHGRDGKSYKPPSRPSEPKLAGGGENKKPPLSTPHRDRLIVDIDALLARDFRRTTEDLVRLISGQPDRVEAMSTPCRVELARKMLNALGLTIADLGGVP